jgi:hypothetical protein
VITDKASTRRGRGRVVHGTFFLGAWSETNWLLGVFTKRKKKFISRKEGEKLKMDIHPRAVAAPSRRPRISTCLEP